MIFSQHIYRIGLPTLMCLPLLVQISPTEVGKPANSKLKNPTNSTNGQSSGISWMPFLVSSMVMAIIGFLCNTVLISVIIIDRLGILRKGPWLTIINLAFADTITCSTMFFLNYPKMFDQPIHIILVAISNTGMSASFFFLTLLTVEIYVVTRFPLERKSIMTQRMIVVVIMCIWFLAMATAIPDIFQYLKIISTNRAYVLYTSWIGVLEFSVFIQLIVKILIIREILKSGRSAINNNKKMAKHKNIAKTVMMLNFILLITAVPYFIARQLEYLAKMGKMGENLLLKRFPYYYTPVALVNFVANPVIYAWRLPDYRRALLGIFRGGNRKSSFNLHSITQRSLLANNP